MLTSELRFAVGTLLGAACGRLLLPLLFALLLWLAEGRRALLLPVLLSPRRQLPPHLEAVAEAPVALPRRRPLPPVLPLLVAASVLSIHILPAKLLLPSACTAGAAAAQAGSWGWKPNPRWDHIPRLCKVTARQGIAEPKALILPLTCVAGTQLNIEADIQHLCSCWGATSASSCGTSTCTSAGTGTGSRSSSCSSLLRPLLLLLLPLRLRRHRRGFLHCCWPPIGLFTMWCILVQDVLAPHLPGDAPRRGAARRRRVHCILHALHLPPAEVAAAAAAEVAGHGWQAGQAALLPTYSLAHKPSTTLHYLHA